MMAQGLHVHLPISVQHAPHKKNVSLCEVSEVSVSDGWGATWKSRREAELEEASDGSVEVIFS